MKLKQKKQLLNLFLGVVIIAVIGCLLLGNKALCFASIGLCIVYGIVCDAVWRCPKCNGSLGRGKPKHCPHCGKPVEY